MIEQILFDYNGYLLITIICAGGETGMAIIRPQLCVGV